MSSFDRRSFLAIFVGFSAFGVYQIFGKRLFTTETNRWTYLFNYVSRHVPEAKILETCSVYDLRLEDISVERVNESIISDFENGDIVNVNGWVLSRAEVCASNLNPELLT